MAKVQLTGGNFQGPSGTVLANGYFTMQLSSDAEVPSTTQVGSGDVIKITLDSNGNVVTNPVQSVWPNDQLNPTNTYYIVNVYSATGQLVWGPQYVQVVSGSTFDVGTWVPQTQPGDGGGPIAVTLETNGVLNGSQTLLNLQQGTGITLSENNGTVTINSSGLSNVLPFQPFVFYTADQMTNGSSTPLVIGSGTSLGAIGSNAVVSAANLPARIRCSTSTTVNTNGGLLRAAGSGGTALNGIRRMVWLIKPNILTNSRYWIYFTSNSSFTTIGNVDTTTQPIAAFRLSSIAGDTTWKIMVQTSNLAANPVFDTGIVPDTVNMHAFEMRWDGTNLSFYYDNGFLTSFNINLPVMSSTNWAISAQENNQNSGTAVSFDFQYLYMEFMNY